MLDQMSVAAIVEQEIKTLLMETNDEDVSLTMQDQLHGLDLNSLLLARLIVQLDTVLEVEPFATGATIADVRTIGDLVAVYERAGTQIKVAN